jgi:hypothetical protein
MRMGVTAVTVQGQMNVLLRKPNPALLMMVLLMQLVKSAVELSAQIVVIVTATRLSARENTIAKVYVEETL